MGIDPVIFGKYFWGTMHLTALGAPKTLDATQTNTYNAFFTNIAQVLPCESCKEHLRQTYSEIPLDDALAGSDALFAWTVNVHNAVNKRLGKAIVSVDDAKRIWLPSNDSIMRKNKSCTDNVLTIAVVTAVLATGVVLAYMYASPSKSNSRS